MQDIDIMSENLSHIARETYVKHFQGFQKKCPRVGQYFQGRTKFLKFYPRTNFFVLGQKCLSGRTKNFIL